MSVDLMVMIRLVRLLVDIVRAARTSKCGGALHVAAVDHATNMAEITGDYGRFERALHRIRAAVPTL